MTTDTDPGDFSFHVVLDGILQGRFSKCRRLDEAAGHPVLWSPRTIWDRREDLDAGVFVLREWPAVSSYDAGNHLYRSIRGGLEFETLSQG